MDSIEKKLGAELKSKNYYELYLGLEPEFRDEFISLIYSEHNSELGSQLYLEINEMFDNGNK